MTYTGATRVFKWDSTISGNAGSLDYISAMLYKNGVAVPKTVSYGQWDNLGDRGLATAQGLISMTAGDYIELWVANQDGTTDMTVTDVNIQAIAVNQ